MIIEQKITEIRILEIQAMLNGYTDKVAGVIVKEYSKLVNNISSQVTLGTIEEVEAVVTGLASELSVPVSRTFGAAGMASKVSIDSVLSWDGAVEGFKPVAMSRNQLEGLALTQKINGKVLVGSLEGAISQDLTRLITEKRIEGKGIAQMSREIKKSLGSEMTLRNIKTEARTYTATASSYARELTYSQNQDMVKGYKLLSTLENGNVNTGQGTCPRCAAMDSQQWAHGEQRALTPFHPN